MLYNIKMQPPNQAYLSLLGLGKLVPILPAGGQRMSVAKSPSSAEVFFLTEQRLAMLNIHTSKPIRYK